MKTFIKTALLAFAALSHLSVQAAPVFYITEASFLAAASGIALTRETFDSYASTTTVSSITSLASGLNISSNAPLGDVNNAAGCSGGAVATGNNCIVFSTPAGGSNQTYTFDSGAVNAFGLFLGDLSTGRTTTLTLMTSSGASQSYTYTNLASANELYFGIIDFSASFTSVTVTNSSQGDTVYIDDVRFGLGDLPEPGSLTLAGLSLACLAVSRRRRA